MAGEFKGMVLISENLKRNGRYCNDGDIFRRFRVEKAIHEAVNGIEFVQRLDSESTIIDIDEGASDCIEKLEQFLARFLYRCAESSALIAEIRSPSCENNFPFSSMACTVNRGGRMIGELPVASVQNLRLNWFESHYTLICVGDCILTADEYVKKARRLCPDTAMKRGLIRAYVAGAENEGYVLGLRGKHPEILPELKRAISGEGASSLR